MSDRHIMDRGIRTAGIEKEFINIVVSCRQNGATMADNTLLFSSHNVDYYFETQGGGSQNNGTLEAVTTANATETPDADMPLVSDEIAFVANAARAIPNNYEGITLDDFVRNLGRERRDLGFRMNAAAAPCDVFRYGPVCTAPQITVTHELRLVHHLFSNFSCLGGLQHGSNYREAMLQDAAANGETLYNEICDQRQIREPEEQARVKSYFTLLMQALQVAQMRNSGGFYRSSGGNFKVDNRWTKDDFGLLPKTPLPNLFRGGLSRGTQSFLTDNCNRAYNIVGGIFQRCYDVSNWRTKAMSATVNPGDGSSDTFVFCYFDAAFGRGGQDPIAMWRDLLGDSSAQPICHPDPILQRVRVAFEYRQLVDDNEGDAHEKTLSSYRRIADYANQTYEDYRGNSSSG